MDQSALFEPARFAPTPVFRMMRRHLWLSLAIILGCLAPAAVISRLWPKSYTAVATLTYDPQIPLFKGGGGVAMTDAQRDAAIDAQLAQVTTLAVAEDVAHVVDLTANPKLQKQVDKVTASSERKLSAQEALGTALLDHVKARRVGETPMFTIAFSTGNAVQAALIANRFAASYVKFALAQKAASANGSASQLATRVAALRMAANAADGQLAAFRLANHLLEQPDASALGQEVAALRGQLADAHGQAALAGTRSAVGGMGEGATVVGGGSGGSVDTTAVSALTQQRAIAAADLAALLGRYGDRHPDVIAAREKLAEVDAQLAQVMHGNSASAAVEARAAGARAQALSGSLDAAETRLAGNVSHDPRLLDLQNSALAARLAYQDALKISADQTAERALVQPDAQVTAFAYPPLRPTWPRLRINLLVALVFGVIAAAAAGVMREARLRTLGTVADIVRWLELDFFAPLPSLAPGDWAGSSAASMHDPIDAGAVRPQSAFAASVRSLATAALFAARKRDTTGGRVIGIASACRGEGRTTVSIAVGRALMSAGMKVALIDADPHGGARMGVPGTVPGRSGEVGTAPRIDASGLALYAGGTGRDALPFAANGGELPRLIAALRGEYDAVIVDTPSILPDVDRQLLAGMDALVLLIRWRKTPVQTVRKAMRAITAAGGHISGAALSMVRDAAAGSAMS